VGTRGRARVRRCRYGIAVRGRLSRRAPLLRGRGLWALRARGTWWRERRRVGARRGCPPRGRLVLAGGTHGHGWRALKFSCRRGWEGWTHREGVIEDKYDYSVRIIGDVCVGHVVGWRGTHGVTSTSFPARKGSRIQRRGSLSLSCGRPIYAVSTQTTSATQCKNRTSSYASRLLRDPVTIGPTRERHGGTYRGVLNRLVVIIYLSSWECSVTSIGAERLGSPVKHSGLGAGADMAKWNLTG
jgi:hypothetical protein